MKKLSTGLATVVLLNLFGLSAIAEEVTFKGLVSVNTCNVDIDGIANSPVVSLPLVLQTSLATVGATTGAKEFRINLTNCAGDIAKARAIFVGNNVTSSGNLGNTGTAVNVSIQISNKRDSSVINFSNPYPTSLYTALGQSYIPLVAKYYAEGNVEPGSVIASAQYAIIYE